MREYTSLLELVRSESLISESIKATYYGVWHPKSTGKNVRYVYRLRLLKVLTSI